MHEKPSDRPGGPIITTVRLDRLLGIVLHLLDAGQASAGELARRFSTSERTIYRDMEALSLAGIPLVSLPGAGGGYQLAERYSLDRGFLSAAELASLRAVLGPLARASGDEKLALALGKLAALGGPEETLLPPPITVSPFPWGWEPGPPAPFALLRRAIDARRLVRLDYSGQRSRDEGRVVEPFTLLLGGQSWYLHAFCRLRDGFRLFRLSRIESAEVLEEGFDPHARLPCPPPWGRDWGMDSVVDVTIRLPESARLLVLDRFPRGASRELPGGGWEVRLRWPEGDDLVRYLLGFGRECEVIAPAALRRKLMEAAESIAERNG
jgi:predicted DNA-binding transcriptional regulator YafY